MNRQISLNLVVLRSPDKARAVAFYAILGPQFHEINMAMGRNTLPRSFGEAFSRFILTRRMGHPRVSASQFRRSMQWLLSESTTSRPQLAGRAVRREG
jgi:hypothetical protein